MTDVREALEAAEEYLIQAPSDDVDAMHVRGLIRQARAALADNGWREPTPISQVPDEWKDGRTLPILTRDFGWELGQWCEDRWILGLPDDVYGPGPHVLLSALPPLPQPPEPNNE